MSGKVELKRLYEIAGAGVLHKAMSVIDAVAGATEPARISDLVERTELPLGTLHRLLSALVSERLLNQDARTKTYRLGSRISELSSKAGESLDVAKLVEQDVAQLNALTGEAVAVALMEGDQLVNRAKRDGSGLLRTSVKIGERLPMHATAMGKAVLAFMDPDQFRRALRRVDSKRYTPRTIVDAAALNEELSRIRQSGVATENEEYAAGVCALAAPLLDRWGYAIGALAISGPSINLTADSLESWTARLIETAQHVSVQLGGDPPRLNPVSPAPGAVPPELELRLRIPAYLGTSPVWDRRVQRLYWVDLPASTINWFDPKTGANEAFQMESLTCGVGLHDDPDKLVVAMHTQICLFDIPSRTLTPLVTASPDHREHRFNKSSCDVGGRFWTADMHMGGLPGASSLYRLDPDGSFHTMDSGLTLPNAIAWSPDERTLYLADSGARTIYAYAFDPASGQIGERRALVEVAPSLGRPAGLAVDRDGFLWSTHSDGWRISRYSPKGETVSFISLPVPSANACSFGDDDLGTLYITTARDRLPPRRLIDAPLAGSIFSYRPGVYGTGFARFGSTGRF